MFFPFEQKNLILQLLDVRFDLISSLLELVFADQLGKIHEVFLLTLQLLQPFQ